MKIRKRWSLSMSFWVRAMAALGVLLSLQVGLAQASRERALIFRDMSLNGFEQQPLRLKIITTRGLTLHWQDLLAEKTHPTTHLIGHLNTSLLNSFKSAQAVSNSSMSAVVIWPSPTPSNLPVIDYLQRWTELIELSIKDVMPLIDQSPLVEKLTDEMSSEDSLALQNAKDLSSSMAQLLRTREPESPAQSALKSKARLEARLELISHYVLAMEPHLPLITTHENRVALEQTLSRLKRLQQDPLGQPDLLRTLREERANPASPYRRTQTAMFSAQLPESGDIEGSLASFESVYRLDLGWKIVDRVLELTLMEFK